MIFTCLDSEHLPDQADAVELRVDLMPKYGLGSIKNILKKAPYPILLAGMNQTEKKIEELLALQPPFFDLRWDLDVGFIKRMIEQHPQTRFIISYHNFEKIPDDLESIFLSMSQFPAFQYKIACQTSSTNDALKLLLFGKNRPQLSVICMGDEGSFARILALENRIHYAHLGKKTAPGQLHLSELTVEYRIKSLNQNTALYGLIGDPVIESRSHLHHNGVFAERNLNAVYVKMTVRPHELKEFIPLVKKMGFRGLSVTMPLKEAIIPFLDEIDEKASRIGAVNTLLIQDGKIFGTNTDGSGALDAIEKRTLVHGKKVVLLGAGGSARAIAYEATKRGADVLILNRTVEKADALAQRFQCKSGSLSQIPTHYDILINATSHPMPILKEEISPASFVLDVLRPPMTSQLLKEASFRGCVTIDGNEMFLNQAKGQTHLWLNS